MALSRYPRWRQRGSELLTGECVPAEAACVSADGRTFSRSDVLALISAGREAWTKFRASLPPIQWYRVTSDRRSVWLPGFFFRLEHVDFRRQDFSEYDLTGCDFRRCNFGRVKFDYARFAGTGPHGSFEPSTKLIHCNLRSAVFVGSGLDGCNFEGSDLSHAELNGVSLSRANLRNAKLFRSIIAANFDDTVLSGTNFAEAYLLGSEFIDTDLSQALNLAKAKIFAHITLDHRTLFKSGVLPKIFYRSCGPPERLIEYLPALVENAKRFESCFLSYSSKDEKFTTKLYEDLQKAESLAFTHQTT
jgi:hypothetical protein